MADTGKIASVLLVHKESGMTSHDVVEAMRNISGIQDIGHTGSLDPDATGLLLLCLGRALKVVQYLDGMSKVYHSTFRMGVRTNTDDAAGVVTEEHDVPDVSHEEMERYLELFRGEIDQRPPIFSAVKIKGKRSYRLAREGKSVDIPPRKVTVNQYTLLSWNNPLLEVEVDCTKGTFIRSLARDLGDVMGCGGIVQDLHRLRIGPFHVDRAYRLEEIESTGLEGMVLSVDQALDFMERVNVTRKERTMFIQGSSVSLEKKDLQGLVRVFHRDEFLGVGLCDEGWLRPRKVFV